MKTNKTQNPPTNPTIPAINPYNPNTSAEIDIAILHFCFNTKFIIEPILNFMF